MHHRIANNAEACLDIERWLAFLPSWDGMSYILDTYWITSQGMSLYTNTSGSLCWGAYWTGRWLQAHWASIQSTRSIMWKELCAIVCTVHT